MGHELKGSFTLTIDLGLTIGWPMVTLQFFALDFLPRVRLGPNFMLLGQKHRNRRNDQKQ